MVAISSSAKGTTTFNAKGLSAVDSYFGVAADDSDVGAATIDQRPQEKPKDAGMKILLKTSMKRRRKEVDEDSDSPISDDDDEEEGRTFISKETKPQKAPVLDKPKLILHEKKTSDSRKEKPEIQEEFSSKTLPHDEDVDVPWHRSNKRKKCRSRQKNIRKDNRDVKPSFTKDPTAPGYRPLTEETKAFLRNKASKKCFSPLISKLNQEST